MDVRAYFRPPTGLSGPRLRPTLLALLRPTLLALLLAAALAMPLRAQVPDTTRADTIRADTIRADTIRADTIRADTIRADTIRADTTNLARPDTLRPSPPPPDTLAAPLPLLNTLRGEAVVDIAPVRHPLPAVSRLVATAPGSFLFDLGASGWPHGWSWEGLSPQRTTLLFEGHPYDDPVTGRPRFDLLPPAFLRAPHVGLDPHGGPVGVHTQARLYDVDRPLTELRYRRDNASMQSIGVAHVQQREVTPFGTPSLLHIVGGYYGRAADNEYPNSDLRRERRLLGRVRLRGASWSVDVRNLHTRRHIGAHGGVEPQGGVFNTVYNRTIAGVRLNRARRRLIRNDLALTARTRLPGLEAPLTASAAWTAQTLRYTGPDTLTAQTNRVSGYVRQDLTGRAHAVRLEGGVLIDRLRATNAWSGRDGRTRLYATVRDSIGWGALSLQLNGGVHATDRQTYPSAAVQPSYTRGRVGLFADVRLTGQPVSWIETAGFGPAVQPLDDVPTGRILLGRVGVRTELGAFDIGLTGFAHAIRSPVDLYATATPDAVVARASDTPFRRAGATLALGWRRNPRAGLYATARATAVQMLTTDDPLAARVADTLPHAFGQGRLGARFVAFQGDLNADLYVRGRAWTRFRSRQFHPPTGRLAVPPAGAPVLDGAPDTFGPSGTLDVTLEAGIREATLFFTMENVLSGTSVQPGVLVVPVYPLPERRFRFGVFWPIWN